MVFHLGRVIIQIAIVAAPIIWRSFKKAYDRAAQQAPKLKYMEHATRIPPMTIQEAHKILGTSPETPKEDITKIYQRLFGANRDYLYIQSKIYRAKECIEKEYDIRIEEPPSMNDSSTSFNTTTSPKSEKQ